MQSKICLKVMAFQLRLWFTHIWTL